MTVHLTIDDQPITAAPGATILEATLAAGIYIPHLCYHPDLGGSHGLAPAECVLRQESRYPHDRSGPAGGYPGCRLCLVEVKGRPGLHTACDMNVEEGLVVTTGSEAVVKKRQDHLVKILTDHPHACLLCAQREGCSRTQCSSNVPEQERCCELLGNCELQQVADHIGIRPDIPKFVHPGLPVHDSEPLFVRDYNLCIACLRCVRACNDLRGVDTLGYVYHDGRAMVGPTAGRDLANSHCHFCGACVEVCPTGALTDKELGPGDRKEALVPCRGGCPAGLDIPRYIHHVRRGEPVKALAVIRERLPLPTVLGLVCFHPCEAACRRNEVNGQPMAICALKRHAADHGGDHWIEHLVIREDTGKRVAIVGSGPAGLSAAYYLRLAGHEVMVYEAELEVGGMLRYAIPDYRLPPEVVEREIEIFKQVGVNFRCNVSIGKDLTLERLQQRYDAVFLGTGATLSKRIPLEGSDKQGVLWGVDFLKQVKTGELTALEGRVLVIGGGNVALDVARTALRSGARRVELACLEAEAEMPAHDWEIEEAREEGVIMHPSWGPEAVLGGDRVQGLKMVKCVAVFDEKGHFAPQFNEAVTKTLEADMVILAIGQASDLSYAEATGLRTDRGTLAIDEASGATGRPGIFAGGEASRGPSSVVEAVADGARAAAAMDRYLGGSGDLYTPLVDKEAPETKLVEADDFAGLERIAIPVGAPAERVKSFELVERTYSVEQARAEAARCLRCDLRLQIAPVVLPPARWLELNAANAARVPAAEGVVQLLDDRKQIIAICGVMDMRELVEQKVQAIAGAAAGDTPGDAQTSAPATKAAYFDFELDPMYSQRESELIQQFLQQHGRMPEGDGEDDDDDLF